MSALSGDALALFHHAELKALDAPGVRWTGSRKRLVCDLVSRGALAADVVISRWGIHGDELAAWLGRYNADGFARYSRFG